MWLTVSYKVYQFRTDPLRENFWICGVDSSRKMSCIHFKTDNCDTRFKKIWDSYLIDTFGVIHRRRCVRLYRDDLFPKILFICGSLDILAVFHAVSESSLRIRISKLSTYSSQWQYMPKYDWFLNCRLIWQKILSNSEKNRFSCAC